MLGNKNLKDFFNIQDKIFIPLTAESPRLWIAVPSLHNRSSSFLLECLFALFVVYQESVPSQHLHSPFLRRVIRSR